MSIPNTYTKGLWKEFRLEVIERDGEACTQCGRGKTDKVVLQVHHNKYRKGAMPWEYDYDECRTLCQGCHAQIHGLIRPSFGWDYLGDEDLGGLDGACEYCGTSIRYVYHIQHPSWEPLAVGIECCDNLTGTTIASSHAESMRRFVTRRARFIDSKRWKESAATAAIRQKRINILIQEADVGFQIQMDGYSGKERFHNIEDAKRKVFDVIENGDAEKYLDKKKQERIAEELRQQQRTAHFRKWRKPSRYY